jgi:hypothetical protein
LQSAQRQHLCIGQILDRNIGRKLIEKVLGKIEDFLDQMWPSALYLFYLQVVYLLRRSLIGGAASDRWLPLIT